MLVLEISTCLIIFVLVVRGHQEGLLLWLNRVKSSVPHSQFDLNTNLQAVAVNVTLSKKETICSIYLPPNDIHFLNMTFMGAIISQF